MTAQIDSIWIILVQCVNIEDYFVYLATKYNITIILLLFFFFADLFVHASASLRQL